MKNDTRLVCLEDLRLAMGLLTRLPAPQPRAWDRQAQAAWAYPIIGALLGALAGFAGYLVMLIGLPPSVVALVTLTALIVMSGALHEDGLADCADGFWGGWTVARRLEIMKDSQIGSYGVIALILSLGARWAILTMLWQIGPDVAVPAILGAAILSRAGLPVLMCALPHARANGLSHSVGAVPRRTALLAVAVATALGVAVLGTQVIGTLLGGAAVLAGLAILAKRKIGGQTGDVLGTSQQITEIAVLLILVA